MSKKEMDVHEEFSQRELEEMRLGAETGQIILKKLLLQGDDSIPEKSRRLLRLFARQVLTNRNDVSPALLYWVALSIGDFVTGKEKSLDAAFRIKMGGRPLALTPNRKVQICDAYTQKLRDEMTRLGTHDLPSEAFKAAEDAAYAVVYGEIPANSKLDKGSIDDALTRIRKVLKEYRLIN